MRVQAQPVGITASPASAPTSPASAQPRVSIRPTSTPSSRETSGANAAARIRRPDRGPGEQQRRARPSATSTETEDEHVVRREQRDAADGVASAVLNGRREVAVADAVDHAEHRLDQDQHAERRSRSRSAAASLGAAERRQLDQRAEHQAGDERGGEARASTSRSPSVTAYATYARGHRHRALREVDHPGARARSARAPARTRRRPRRRQAVDGQEDEPVHASSEPQVARVGGSSSARSSAAGPLGDDPAEREHDALVGDRQRAAHVLLDEQHGQAGARRAGRAAAP